MPIKQYHNGQPMNLKHGEASYIVCCDCGLTHAIVPYIKGTNTVILYVYRDDYQTKKQRQRKKKK